ncbi:hypothetical protein CRE_16142 [Caenorhabditis remanei]|uniref:Uncharacterized protein n=1 Tax=Caenorhabditis remanei TaxID=31234 RepID=E3MB94_CAERE|nr:hypothetical protein CRE_16142 [Caenorhabditis remanei]
MKLFQLYVMNVWTRAEQNNFIRSNHSLLHIESLSGLQVYVVGEEKEPVRMRIMLSAFFTGFPGEYQDSIAMVAKLGKPDYFMTVTRNPFYPEYLPNFQQLPHFDLYIKNSTYVFMAAVFIMVSFLLCLVLTLIIVDIFRLMSTLKLKISLGTFKKHKDATRSLVVQITTTILCIFPIALVVVLVVSEFRNAQFIGSICLILFTAHSSINIISLFIFFPPFREYASEYMSFMRKRKRTTECKKLGTFRFYLLAYLSMCVITDIHLTFLMQCVPLFPFLAGYSVGILSEWFGISLHYNIIIAFSIVILQIESLMMSFIQKHQVIAIILKTHILPNFLYFLIYIFCLITPLYITLCFNVFHVEKEEQFRYIAEFYPEYLPSFQQLSHFEFYIKNSTYVYMAGFVFIFLTIVCSGLTLTIMDIFRLMGALKLQISAGTFKKHKDAIRSLIVQITTTIFCLSPVSLMMVFVVLEFRNAQFLISICLVLFTAHSSINIISLFIFFPPFREYASRYMPLHNKAVGSSSIKVLSYLSKF